MHTGWHGTSATDPKVILSSEEGFDKTFSSENCMWGKGLYFAENANYSYNYSYKNVAMNSRTFFLAEILLGEIKVLPSDTTLKTPPVNQLTNKPYDSVQGNTNGSDVYMVYANQKVYPRYLVTYQ